MQNEKQAHGAFVNKTYLYINCNLGPCHVENH